ncbi:hypothetical protein [Nocardioides sp.]|uniref:hypothetical protein n=1 Tax=Nocardioides sp. TaxID=35761 RepID=UPI003D0C05A7
MTCGSSVSASTATGGQQQALQPTPPSPRENVLEPTGAAPDWLSPAPLPPSRRSAGLAKILGVGALVAALAAGGFVAYQVLSPQGGASTPDAAVRQFIESVAKQDPVGALAVVNPGEVEGVVDLYEPARERLADAGLTSSEGDLADAVDVALGDVELDIDQVADSVAKVTVQRLEVTASFDPEALPPRLEFMSERYSKARSWEGDLVAEVRDNAEEGFELSVTAVKVDGRWYVSPVASYLDAVVNELNYWARESGDSPITPDYDAVGLADAPDPVVAKDPEDAVRKVIEAASDEDFEELLAALPEEQVNVLRAYVEPAEDLLAEAGADFDIDLSELDTDVAEDGDHARMTIDSAAVAALASVDGEVDSGSVRLDGRCVEVADEYDTDSGCIDGDIRRMTGVDSFFVILSKRDGGWQVDPMATAVAYSSDFLSSASDELVDDVVTNLCYEVSRDGSSCE